MENLIWEQLDRAFTVSNIMTPRKQLITINSSGSLQESKKENFEFDIIPIERDSSINTFILKECPNQEQEISQEWLLSSDSTIPDLLNIFLKDKKPGLFIFQKQEIIGLVTPADLNKIEFRVYIYLLISQLEIKLSDFVIETGKCSNGEIYSFLSDPRKEEILEKEEKLQKLNLDPKIIELLYLSDLFTIIQKNEQLYNILKFSSCKQTKKAMSGINDLRNITMHPSKSLISSKDDGMETLANRINRIRDLLDRIESSSNN